MSRPRTPYGPKLPGRLHGTMIKVLAAEMSDQGRLSRGKQLWADDAVIDIVVGHGAVTAEVQGSRPEPYVVTLRVAGGAGVPTRRELWVQCTCPDDTGTGADACKHVVAALFTMSDEVTIEPELVDRWRDSDRRPRPHERGEVTELSTHARPDTHDHRTDDEHDTDAEVIELYPNRDQGLDKISVLLQAPGGAAPPRFPYLEPLRHHGLRDRLLHDVLHDAIEALEIRWD